MTHRSTSVPQEVIEAMADAYVAFITGRYAGKAGQLTKNGMLAAITKAHTLGYALVSVDGLAEIKEALELGRRFTGHAPSKQKIAQALAILKAMEGG